MKSIQSVFRAAMPGLAMVILIVDAKCALSGAADGVELCIRTVIPSLFPFLFLSIIVTDILRKQPAGFLRPIGKLCRIPKGAEGLLLVGLLGGYPVGAQAVTQAYQDGWLSQQDARRMLGFSSNAGPAFLFGMIAGAFSNAAIPWILWGVHILSALITGMLLPGGGGSCLPAASKGADSLTHTLEKSLRIMAAICGWVVLFRVVIVFCERWFFWLLPREITVLFSGLLELTNGCCQLCIVDDESVRFLLAAIFLGFGGCCVGLQTQSVTRELGTGMYFPGKVIQTAVSVMLAAFLRPVLFGVDFSVGTMLLSVIGVTGLVFLLNRPQNNSSNFAAEGV